MARVTPQIPCFLKSRRTVRECPTIQVLTLKCVHISQHYYALRAMNQHRQNAEVWPSNVIQNPWQKSWTRSAGYRTSRKICLQNPVQHCFFWVKQILPESEKCSKWCEIWWNTKQRKGQKYQLKKIKNVLFSWKWKFLTIARAAQKSRFRALTTRQTDEHSEWHFGPLHLHQEGATENVKSHFYFEGHWVCPLEHHGWWIKQQLADAGMFHPRPPPDPLMKI